MNTNPTKARLLLMIGFGAAVLLGLVVGGGALVPGSQPSLVIEFGTDPDTFAGLDVEIDGKVAGRLERFGQATRTAFPVEKGRHEVRVVHPELGCRTATVTADHAGQRLMMILDYADEVDAKGGTKPVLTLGR